MSTRRHYINWTPPRQWELMTMVDEGLNDRQIAEIYGRHRHAIHLARRRYGIRSCSQIHHSGVEVSQLMGLSHHSYVYRWIEQGYLRATRQPSETNTPWVITDADLVAFLEDERYWHLWEPDGVDRRFSQQLKLREGVRFLAPKEVAQRLKVQPATVHLWIRRGVLPARRYAHCHYRVLESDLDGFVQPLHKLRRFTDQEDSIVLDMRDRDETWTAIGAVIDRDPAVVQQRWKRLQERRS